MMHEPGILYVVATPIGNLGDISERAIGILRTVDVVACEDTRTTKKLLQHYGIATSTTSYHAHASEGKENSIITRLQNGEKIALVSDAGTPAISDPGVHLIDRIYREAPGVTVIAVPGPSAFVAALSASGLPSTRFTFLGFAPAKKGRQTFFQEIIEYPDTVIFYESVHRIMKALDSMVQVLGETRIIAIGRELTKMHEEVVRGTAIDIRQYFIDNPQKQRGEFVILVAPADFS